ncbi:Prolactin-3B1 [Microtus ochrogaster]|uniref:Prolactin-3B1 n=1 Tax=Microtus ochrogaster TaxID=79684 RepID=A0A8J6G856_MICOH|nr:Prolactin-3B1 [Microtus ochrogaster]
MTNEELYYKLLSISHRTRIVSRQMYKMLDKKLAKGKLFRDGRNNPCHITSIPTSKKTEDVLKVIINVSSAWKYPLKLLTPATLTHLVSYDGMLARAVEVNFGNQEVLEGAKILLSRSEDLLKVTISILQAWEDPVKHMATVVAGLQGAPDVMISRTKELGERMLGLLEGLKIVLSRIQPGAVDIENSFWYGWSDLQSSDEDTRNIALYTLGRCVRRDTHKVDNFLKVLKCRDVHNNNC